MPSLRLIVSSLLLATVSWSCKLDNSSPASPPEARYARPEAVVTELHVKGQGYKPQAATELKFDEPTRRYLLDYARAICDGDKSKARELTRPEGFEDPQAPVIALIYDVDGGRKAHHRADSKDTPLTAQIETAATEVCKRDGRGDQLHLLVVTYTARLPNFGSKGIFDNKVFEPQVYGVAVEYGGRRVEVDPVIQVEANRGSKGVREHINKALGSSIDLFTTENKMIVEIYKVAHFGERRTDGSFVDFYRGHTVLRPEDVTTEMVRERIGLIGDWYRNNIFGSEVVYEYSVSSGSYRDKERTMVRSLMATWVLNRLAFFLDDEELKDLGEEVIEHYLDDYFQIEKSREAGKIIPSTKKLPIGNVVKNRYTSASFVSAAILERDDYARWAGDTAMLMEWTMGFQRDDGVLYTEYPQSQYFMPGHLMLSLAYHYNKLGEPYKQWFDGIYDTYEIPVYQMMELADGRYHPLAPAWFTQPAAAMYHKTGDDRYRDFVYAINDRVVKLHEHNRAEMLHYDYDGILTPKLGYYGNNSVTAAALESLADAAIVARKDGDTDRYKAYTTVVRHTTAYLMRIQFTPDNTYYVKHRERAVGGFKKDMVSSVLWMDNVWHLTSAFIKIYDAKLIDDAQLAPPM
jgi:hypothetical protein